MSKYWFKSRGNSLPPTGPAPCPGATILEVQTPKLCSLSPQGLVLASASFLLYPSQLETNRGEYVPLSNPMGTPLPVQAASSFPTSQALSRLCLPVLLPLLRGPLVAA